MSSSASVSTVPKVESKDESTTMEAPKRFVNVRSLIISWNEGCGRASKLKHLADLAKESRLEVKSVDSSAFQFGSFLRPEVVTCGNVDTIDLLKHAIKHSESAQLLLGTSLTEEQLTPNER